jgi:hypothetical protein
MEGAAMMGPAEFRDRLARALAGELEDAEITAERGRGYKVLGFVVSPKFEGMDEGERQDIAWSAIMDEFSLAEQAWIEFIYTDAPSEIAAESTS